MLKELLSPSSTELFSLDRCKALVDGVFAIVITLLVLGIDVPTDHPFSKQGLFAFMTRIGFDLLLYAISFWLAGTYWVQHAAIMQYFRHGSRMLIWINLLFLFPGVSAVLCERAGKVSREETARHGEAGTSRQAGIEARCWGTGEKTEHYRREDRCIRWERRQ